MVVGYIMAAIVTATTFLIHALIFTVLLCTPSLRCKKANQLLMTLNVAHALTSIFSLTRVLYFDRPYPGLLSYVVFGGYCQGNIALVVLTVDRCIMIRWPFRYQALPRWFHVGMIGVSPAIFVTIFTTAVSTQLATRPVRESDMYIHTVVYGITIFTVILLLSNSLVYVTLLKQRRSIKALFKMVPKNPVQQPPLNVTPTTKPTLSFLISSNGKMVAKVAAQPSSPPPLLELATVVQPLSLIQSGKTLLTGVKRPSLQPPIEFTTRTTIQSSPQLPPAVPSGSALSSSVTVTPNMKKREFRSFYLCFGCVVTYVVFWLPTLINEAVRLHINYNTSSDVSSGDIPTATGTPVFSENLANMLLILNPLADAVILVWFNKELKHKIKLLILSCRKILDGDDGAFF